jgi:hypothetical protein
LVIGYQQGYISTTYDDFINGDMLNNKLGIFTNAPGVITGGTPCMNVAGDIIINTLTQTGDLKFTNATLSATSGGNSGQHLRLIINGTPYKIRLEDD